ncbi:MAG: helix-turn-helix transcriptional regulator [Rhizobiales bacterium]|nr:helix-turn-helix transcriptional regulator [Hyphomicrobiales bacterium]
MQTRIRDLRKRRGLTLKELAARIGTTPQTVQRLETANMTVSTDWLDRISTALGVRPVDLLEDREEHTMPLLGNIARHGRIVADRSGTSEFELDLPATSAVAANMSTAIGPYAVGSVLIGDRQYGSNMANAIGRDCLVGLEDGSHLLRRLVAGFDPESYTLVPLSQGEDVIYDARLVWAAPIVMVVNYL